MAKKPAKSPFDNGRDDDPGLAFVAILVAIGFAASALILLINYVEKCT